MVVIQSLFYHKTLLIAKQIPLSKSKITAIYPSIKFFKNKETQWINLILLNHCNYKINAIHLPILHLFRLLKASHKYPLGYYHKINFNPKINNHNYISNNNSHTKLNNPNNNNHNHNNNHKDINSHCNKIPAQFFQLLPTQEA